MVPPEMLPRALGWIGKLLPATHAMNAFVGLALGKTTAVDPFWSLAILLAGGVSAFALAAILFRWDSAPGSRRRHPALAVLALLPYVVAAVVLG